MAEEEDEGSNRRLECNRELETTLQAAVLTLLRANSLPLSNSALSMKKPMAGGQRSDTTHLSREGKSPRRDQRPTARAKSQRSAELQWV